MKTMKALHLALALTSLSVATANAGSEHLVKQKAKEVRDQQNERQGVTPASPNRTTDQPAAGTPPARTLYTTRQAAPALSPQVANLSASLGAIQQVDSATEEHTRQLTKSLSAAAQGPVEPSTGKINKLAGDLSRALEGTELSSARRNQLAQQIDSALKDTLSAKEMEALTSEIHDTLRDAGAGRVDAAVVSNDLKSIIAEIQRGGSK